MTYTTDEKYMLRCIEIAKNGIGTTAPNPSVGAIVVHNGKIIGEGFTSPFGGAHAEVNAIGSVKNKALLPHSILYVTLEPCSHHGKTPPCADLVLRHNIPRVVIGLRDPHIKVAGKGIQKLKDGGCEVHTGIMEKACRLHHKRFLKFHEEHRPYIILKWAQTSDGFMAPESHERDSVAQPYWITNKASRQRVHFWRSQEQGILVGTNTVLADNPKLNVRLWSGKSPIPLVMDRLLKIPSDFHVLNGAVPAIVLTETVDKKRYTKENAYAMIDFSKPLPEQICNQCYKASITSLFIEGGARTLRSFIDSDLWDEARVFTGNQSFQEGLKAPTLPITPTVTENLSDDILNIYYR